MRFLCAAAMQLMDKPCTTFSSTIGSEIHHQCRNPGSQPRQGVTRLRAKKEARESCRMLPRVQESEGIDPHTPKGTPTLGVGVPVDS
jgi:hypothetical protein